MCKNFSAFAAGVVALSFLGLGSRICIAEMMLGSRIHAACPACEIAFWVAAFSMPFLVGMFIGALGGPKSWMCAGMAAVTALVIRTFVVGMALGQIVHSPMLGGLSILYVIMAVVGGVVGSAVISYRPVFSHAVSRKPNRTESAGTAQSHSHDNLAF